MALFDYIETFFFISLGITLVFIFLIVYHFKQRITSIEKKGDTMFEIVNNIMKELHGLRNAFLMQKTAAAPPPIYNHVPAFTEGYSKISDGVFNQGVKPNIVTEMNDCTSSSDSGESDDSDDYSDDDDDDGSENREGEVHIYPEIIKVVSMEQPNVIDTGIRDAFEESEPESESDSDDEEEHEIESQYLEEQVDLEPKFLEQQVDLYTKVLEQQVELDTKVLEQQADLYTKVLEQQVELEPKVLEQQADLEPKVLEQQVDFDTKVLEQQVDLYTKVLEQQVDFDTKVLEQQVELEPKFLEQQTEVPIVVTKLEETVAIEEDIQITIPKPSTGHYRKMQLPQLKTLVIEKGLATDTSKLKKIELIRLLENLEQ